MWGQLSPTSGLVTVSMKVRLSQGSHSGPLHRKRGFALKPLIISLPLISQSFFFNGLQYLSSFPL